MNSKSPLENYSNLFSLFETIYPISDELKTQIIENSKVIEIPKKTKLLSAGENSQTIYFIITGTARQYFLDKQGKESNTWFLF